MLSDNIKPAQSDTGTGKISLPDLYVEGSRNDSKQLAPDEKAGVDLMAAKLAGRADKEEFVSFEMQGKVSEQLRLHEIPNESQKELGKESAQSTEKIQKSIQDLLAKRLKETYKDAWNLLPKEQQETVLSMQNAVISGDLKQLGKIASILQPEVAEQMAQLVEKNMGEFGVKTHLKSADGRLLLYRAGSNHAVLIGGDGKASVVAIEDKEPPNILEGKNPFKAARAAAKEIAANTVKDVIIRQELNPFEYVK
jgi:hypothetical protein